MFATLLLALVLAPQASTLATPHLSDLAWMTGHWRGTAGDATVEQWITDIQGGTLMGMFRSTVHGKIGGIEVYTIREVPGGIEEQVRFFDASLAPDDPKEAVMRVVKTSATEAVFENPSPTGMVRRTTMTHPSPDSFHVHIDLVGNDGKPFTIESDFARVK